MGHRIGALCACGCGSATSRPGVTYKRGHRPPLDPVASFWAKVDQGAESGCWLWTASIGPDGYGRMYDAPRGKFVLAHRFSVGLVEHLHDDLEVDHLCRVRHCVNPDHLEQVSQAENKRREMEARGLVTHCKHGHPYDAENTIVNSKGYRECRVCSRARSRRSSARYLAKRAGGSA